MEVTLNLEPCNPAKEDLLDWSIRWATILGIPFKWNDPCYADILYGCFKEMAKRRAFELELGE